MQHVVEMIVSLKVPDTTALTALQTLRKIGFARIKDAARAEYYRFLIDGDEEKFRQKISKVDVLVNANKHFFQFSIPKDDNLKLLVRNIDGDGASILSLLNKRLGFKNVSGVEKATLWSLKIESGEGESRKIAEKAAKELLANENYQSCEVM